MSVLMPVFNHAEFVREAVQSVVSQTHADLELLMVDDGSTDGSDEVLRHIDDPRVRVLTHPGGVNRGLHASLDLALREARGDVLGALASDDRWRPDYLERLLPALKSAGAAYCRARLVDRDGVPTGVEWGMAAPGGSTLFSQLLRSNVVQAGTILMRRSAFVAAGNSYGSSPYEDVDVMLRVAARTDVAFVEAALCDYRLTGTGIQQGIVDDGRSRVAYAETVAQVALSPNLPRRRRRAARTAAVAWACLLAAVGEGPIPADVRARDIKELEALCRARSTETEELLDPDRLAALSAAHPGAGAAIRRGLT